METTKIRRRLCALRSMGRKLNAWLNGPASTLCLLVRRLFSCPHATCRCMEKMLAADVRHLLVRAEKPQDSEIVGMISVKDIVKCNLAKSNAQKDRLESIIIEQQFLNSPI
mmetsp:Transcript_35166/g.60690  ORF Transcript_35166/g.60690 Transcript_35166/m.60690 type:complete len:111 (+) Transcript_35166:493-825(+)